MALTKLGSVAIPPFRASAFDHGDVHVATGRIFVAHTGAGTVEVIDGERQSHVGTVPGCLQASGVLCAQDAGIVFAAARGAGWVLGIEPNSLAVLDEMRTGPAPNGLAWAGRRHRLLVADVEDLGARLLDPSTGECVGRLDLPGRPRWCVHDPGRDRFLVNVREPACVAVLTVEPFAMTACWPVSATGPHGLDLDPVSGRAFVASDDGRVVALDLGDGTPLAEVAIAGPPDAIWLNGERHLLYVAIGEPGLVEVIDITSMTRCGELATESGAHTIAFDRARQRLAVFLPGSCQVALYHQP